MDHVLDNPAWGALISGNQHLAKGNHQVKFFDPDVSPFVAFDANTTDNFDTLTRLITHANPICLISTTLLTIPGTWRLLHQVKGLQMLYDIALNPAEVTMPLIPLTNKHVPQMLALTKLTKPGPFAGRTIAFGHYYGIFDGDKLVAMTGQRLHCFKYAEVSAVCTHPDYAGRGYAAQLLQHQLHRIKAMQNIPYLHVKHDNHRAINVYKRLGFAVRTEVYFYFMERFG